MNESEDGFGPVAGYVGERERWAAEEAVETHLRQLVAYLKRDNGLTLERYYERLRVAREIEAGAYQLPVLNPERPGRAGDED